MSRVSLCNDQGKYLRLPSCVGKSKYGVFKSFKDNVWHKISNWKNVYLSQVRKEIIIKAVAQAIPTYSMSLS